MFFRGNMGAASGRVNPSHGMTKLRHQNRVVGHETWHRFCRSFPSESRPDPGPLPRKPKFGMKWPAYTYCIVWWVRYV